MTPTSPAAQGYQDGLHGRPRASRDPVYLEFYAEGERDARNL